MYLYDTLWCFLGINCIPVRQFLKVMLRRGRLSLTAMRQMMLNCLIMSQYLHIWGNKRVTFWYKDALGSQEAVEKVYRSSTLCSNITVTHLVSQSMSADCGCVDLQQYYVRQLLNCGQSTALHKCPLLLETSIVSLICHRL